MRRAGSEPSHTFLVSIIALLMLAACSGQAAQPRDEHPALQPSAEAFVEVERCMAVAGYSSEELKAYEALRQDQAEEQVEVPDGPKLPIETAWERCSVRAGTLDIVGDDPAEVADQNERWRHWTTCMVDRGWDVELVQDPSLPNRVSPEYELPSEGEAAAAFNQDLVACSDEAGIPVIDSED